MILLLPEKSTKNNVLTKKASKILGIRASGVKGLLQIEEKLYRLHPFDVLNDGIQGLFGNILHG